MADGRVRAKSLATALGYGGFLAACFLFLENRAFEAGDWGWAVVASLFLGASLSVDIRDYLRLRVPQPAPDLRPVSTSDEALESNSASGTAASNSPDGTGESTTNDAAPRPTLVTRDSSRHGRNWCPKTPLQLIELVSDRTDFAAQRALEPFIGSWLQLSGIVARVDGYDGRPNVVIDVSEGLAVSFLMERGEHTDHVAALRRGDHFTGRGRLRSASITILGHGLVQLDEGGLVV